MSSALPVHESAKPDPSVVCPPCGRCCRYVAVEVDAPTTVARVSTLLWMLYHRGVEVYESHEGEWFVLFPAECENLRPDGLCGVYENRPLICRDYDVDGCEGTSVEPAERARFTDARAFLAWMKEKRKALFGKCEAAGIVPKPLN